MDALLCRRTLLGHQDDVLALSGLLLAERGAESPPHCSADSPPRAAANGTVLGGSGAGHEEGLLSPSSSAASQALFASASADGMLLFMTDD